jgi:ABC-type transport system involved in cytochrome c biogenesis permease subunit
MALLGLLFGLAGVLGYFVVVFRLGAELPFVRNDAVPNWILVGTGLVLSALAVRRAGTGRRVPRVLLGVNAMLAVGFAYLLYGLTVVPATGGPALGAPAPDFSLRDHSDSPVSLADFRGAPVLLVFYRGHW